MLKARLFQDGVETIISAQDVKDGKYSRYDNFVDVEYEFRVRYVNGAKHHGAPHFRLYLSREDYLRLSPEQKKRFEIVRGQRHFQNSFWHSEWQNKVKSFCEIEKYFKDSDTNKRRFADAYYPEKNIRVEFQHSYIDFDFEERNEFFSKKGIKIIWLYDLPRSEVKRMADGDFYEILEDNARGFFRISEKEENLKNNLVFIQTKDGLIYQIDELLRKEIDNSNGLKSTIRYFNPKGIYSEDEFVRLIKEADATLFNKSKISTIFDLWKSHNLDRGVFYNIKTKYYVKIIENPIEKFNKYGRVYGYISKNQYMSFRNDTEIWEPYEDIWELVWGETKGSESL